VVVELDRSARGELVSDDKDPSAVVLALSGVNASGERRGSGAGLVRDWRVDDGLGAVRIRFNVSRQVTVKRRFLLPPGDGVKVYRYVMDLEAREGAALPEPPQRGAVAKQMVQSLSAAPAKTGKRLVVIDAGHGGKDPGASGAAILEKTVTLAAARSLKAKLEKTGRYRVILTRSTDVFIPLPERVAVARRSGADLFISMHADSGTERSLHGASVYTLSERGADRAARKVMTGGDWLAGGSQLSGRDPQVNRILLDLTQRATQNRSSAFARVLLDRLDGRAPLLQKSHRDAGFVVLLAPDVPAVLLEMGFITNPQDEATLTDPVRRERLVDGVASAVDDYFESERRSSTLAALP
jgi:N-acetylmuramoyl-L-alanine amidase